MAIADRITSCPLGTSGFECSFIIYILPALFVFLGLIFRRSVANDLLDWRFSVIGSSAAAILGHFISYGLFNNLKISLVTGIVLFFIGGFGLGEILPDGEASN